LQQLQLLLLLPLLLLLLLPLLLLLLLLLPLLLLLLLRLLLLLQLRHKEITHRAAKRTQLMIGAMTLNVSAQVKARYTM